MKANGEYEMDPNSTNGTVAFSSGNVEGAVNKINDNHQIEVAEVNHVEKAHEVHEDEDNHPTWYCRVIVNHYKMVFGITLGAHIFFLVVTGILLGAGYDLMPIDFDGVPLNLQEDSTKLRTDAWLYIKDDDDVANLNGLQEQRAIQYPGLSLVYEMPGGNIFTKERLLTIKQNEEELFNNTDFRTMVCQLIKVGLGNDTVCKLPLSMIRFFDGTYTAIHKDLYDPNFDNISHVLHIANSTDLSRAILNFHLGANAIVEKDMSTSEYTRTLFYFGWPIPGYINTDDRDEDQTTELNKIIVDIFGTVLENKYKDGVGDMKFYYDNAALSTDAVQRQVILDMLLAVASLVFIFIFMWFQTGSLWLTCWGVFSVLSSFNITNMIYRVVFDYRYFGIFHVLSIFIILGIGSDNVFVFMDTWKQSSLLSFKNLQHRLSFVYKHAAMATLITSFTTMVAFLSNVQSPLLAISSFGLFSAVLVIINYLSVILFYPAAIITFHKSRRGMCCCCPLCSKIASQPATSEQGEEDVPKKKTIAHYVIYFFENPFYKYVITHKVVRWIVLVIFLSFFGITIGFATQIEPDTDQIQIWKSDTNWGKVRELTKDAFKPSQEDKVLIVHVIWGLNEQDRSACHHTDYKCKGKTVFDRSFDPNPPPCQLAMLDLCRKLKNLTKEQEENLKLRRSQVTGEVEIDCVWERMNEFLTVEGENTTKYPPAGENFSFPINGEKMMKLRDGNSDRFTTELAPLYYRFFEIGLAYFITQGVNPNYASSYDFKKYVNYIGGQGDNINAGGNSSGSGGFDTIEGKTYGHRMLYAAIAVNTTLKPTTLGYENGLPIYENWEKFINDEMNALPESFTACKHAFQATVTYHNVWHWLKVQEILVNNAILGIVIGLVLSVVVLTLATTNIIMGLLATLTIAMVTASVLGMIPILGWKLGLFESLNLTLIVGLAVDYVVHLAEGYMVLPDQDRLSRVRYTLGHVGISVFSGACTTIGASIFMLAAKIRFFAQFGIFIFCTIGFSILYSLFFFTTMLALIGPQGQTGSLKPLMRKITDFIRGKTKEHEDCATCKGKGFCKMKKSYTQFGVTNDGAQH